MKIAVWILRDNSLPLAENIQTRLENVDIFCRKSFENNSAKDYPVFFYESIRETLGKNFTSYDAHVFFMSAGIVVRLVSSLVGKKTSDPAVVVVDPSGVHVISLLSGHLGGANELARELATAIGGIPVITTATDLDGLIAFDEVARIIGGKILNPDKIKMTSMSLLDGKRVGLIGPRIIFERYYSRCLNVELLNDFPSGIQGYDSFCLFTDKIIDLPPDAKEKTLVIAMPTLSVGIGCHIGTRKSEIIHDIKTVLEESNLLLDSVFTLASVDAKKNEVGLLEAADELKIPVEFFSADELTAKGKFLTESSDYVLKHVGTGGVAEPSAYLAAGNGAETVVKKQKLKNVTVAVARRRLEIPGHVEKKIYVVGLGPGELSQMTVRARQAIFEANVIVGYKTYIDLIRPIISGKKVISTGMTKEIDRCKRGIEEARKGNIVAIVSSGDAGIYGMAGLVYELLGEGDTQISVEVIPGVTASTAAAAVVGAPLMCDYISLSLSDLLLPTEEVKRRIKVAASSDIVTVLYNPKSKKRTKLIELVKEEFLKYRSPDTPVAIVTNTYRENQEKKICNLSDFTDHEIGMTSLVIIGNSQTEVLGSRMVTRRGYRVA